MTAPRRLLEDPASLRALLGDGASGGDDIGKTLLESGLVDSSSGKAWADGGPSSALKAEMWSSIEAALPLVGAAAAAGGAASAGAAGGGAAGASGAAGGTAASSAAAAGAAGSTAAAAGAGASAIGATAAAPVAGLTFVTKIGLASIFIGGSLAGAGVVRQQLNEAHAPAAIVAPADPAPFTSGDGSQRLPALYDTMGNGSGGPGAEGAGSGGAAAVSATDASRSPSDGSVASTDRAGAEKRSDDASERAHASKKDDKSRGSSEKSGDSSSSASKLVEEAAGVQQARQALAQGSASRALSILGQLDKDIPRGGLGQERAILTIEALAASGQKGQAAQLASAFLAANPSSPYADRARRHTQ